ncbi:hypothetical protein RSAG8_02107, partial [Rhizoctonia solani AG-8 WAC10335]
MDAPRIAARRSEILGAFEGFREELDEHNDRRERIIKTNRDITLPSDVGDKYLDLTESDYLLGVSDLTGELMRLAISTITRKGGRDRALHTAAFVRRCLADFETFSPNVRDLHKKQKETAASLHKIEDALYAIRIREFEHGNKGSFDDIISRFAYNFEKPRNVQDDEGDTGY